VAVRTPPQPKEPERPSITLLGTILGTSESIGIFLNPATRDIAWLRLGEDHEGWALRSVKSREVTLVKDRERSCSNCCRPAIKSRLLTSRLLRHRSRQRGRHRFEGSRDVERLPGWSEFIEAAGCAGDNVGAREMVPKLNPPSVKLVDAEADGLISIAQGIAALDAGQWLLTLYEIDLTPRILREIAKFSKSGSAKSGISSWLRTSGPNQKAPP
jgi:hypothetical protein